MKEELTTAMHGEFTITEATERRENAFTVFELMGYGFTLTDALGRMRLTLQDVAPYVEQWNKLAWNQSPAKQVVLE